MAVAAAELVEGMLFACKRSRAPVCPCLALMFAGAPGAALSQADVEAALLFAAEPQARQPNVRQPWRQASQGYEPVHPAVAAALGAQRTAVFGADAGAQYNTLLNRMGQQHGFVHLQSLSADELQACEPLLPGGLRSLTELQLLAVEESLRGKRVLVLGPAGSGKTAVQHVSRKLWEADGLRVHTTGYTNASAAVVHGECSTEAGYGIVK